MAHLMKRMRVTIDARAVAEGVLAMMGEHYALTGDPESDETLVRFGMLPAKWMTMVEEQMESVIRERFDLLPAGRDNRDEYHTIIRDPEAEDSYRMVQFSVRALVQEMLHEVTLAMYGSVEMVV